jgi:hypothetical protein
MAKTRKKRPSKLISGKVHVKGYTRRPGKLPPRSEKGRFRKGKGGTSKNPQTKLF